MFYYLQSLHVHNITGPPANTYMLEVAEKDNRIIRRHCKSCYTKYSVEQGRKLQWKWNETVRDLCLSNDMKNFMCKKCFYTLHRVTLVKYLNNFHKYVQTFL